MLPKMSGVDVCRAIRARSQVPIIMVTAKGTEIDTVVGLEVGADDYVTKPYRLRELVARMRAVLRRSPLDPTRRRRARGRRPSTAGAVLEVGARAASTPTATGSSCATRRSTCVARSSSSSSLLIENAGRVLTRDTLIDRVWGADYVGDTKTLDVHIKRLRTHVEADPSAPTIITTVRGVGYRFEIPADADVDGCRRPAPFEPGAPGSARSPCATASSRRRRSRARPPGTGHRRPHRLPPPRGRGRRGHDDGRLPGGVARGAHRPALRRGARRGARRTCAGSPTPCTTRGRRWPPSSATPARWPIPGRTGPRRWPRRAT